MRLIGVRAACCAALTLGLPLASVAQSYPSKPVRVIVPLAPGGGLDIIARNLSQQLTNRLGQTFVVDNRSGAGGSIAAELTARAAPDGYTIMLASASFVVHSLLYKARYDPVREFTPVTQVSRQPHVLIVHPSVPVNTVKEFIAYAKANPNKLNYASAGSGSLIHLTGELFKSMTGVGMTHVPYKGIGAAYPDILAGQIQLTFGSIISALPQIKGGKVRAVAVTSRTRSASLPETPTIDESGVPGFDVTQWYGVLGPLNLPAPVVSKLHQEFVTVLKLPDTMQRMAAEGSEPVGTTPADFSAHVRNELKKWGGVIKSAQISGE